MSTEEQYEGGTAEQSVAQFYDKNKNNILIAGVAIMLLAIGIYYYNNNYKPQLEQDASESFFMAERYFSTDSLGKALDGDGINLGMLDIADEYGSTKVGQQAKYYAGRILLEQGKYDEALDYLKDADMDDEFLGAQLITLQGDCLSELDKYSDAGDQYMKAANARENRLSTPYALQKAGLAYEEAGEYSESLEAYTRLSDKYSDTRFAEDVEVRIGRVKAKMAHK